MKRISDFEQAELLHILQQRFHKNTQRHPHIAWQKVEERLLKNPTRLWSLAQMEETGGEPDVIAVDKRSGEIIFADHSAESPKGRRSICYDHEALASRKQYKTENSAINMAKEMGIELMNEQQYFDLQKLGEFDLKTSTWLLTPVDVRVKGGALFGDKRFGRTFIYHNGAESYYGARGFRGILKV